MAFMKAVFKAFRFTKYRWASVEFKDGSVLWGSVTDELWREMTAHPATHNTKERRY